MHLTQILWLFMANRQKVLFTVRRAIVVWLKVWGLWDLFFKEISTFLQRCIKLIKSDSKDIYNVTKDVLSLFIWTSYSSKNPEKSVSVSTEILSSTTVFNIDNKNKCFLSSKSAYYKDFWRMTGNDRIFITEIIYILE